MVSSILINTNGEKSLRIYGTIGHIFDFNVNHN